MEIQDLYRYAKSLVDKIKQEKPAYASEQDAALCLIEMESQEIISGVSCISIKQDEVVTFSAEHVAVVAMVAAGHKKANRVIILSLEDGSLMEPEEDCLNILLRLDKGNDSCEIVTEPDKTMTIAALTAPPPPPVDFFSGFGDEDTDAEEGSVVFDGGFDESYAAPQHATVKPEVTAEPEQAESLGAPADFASDVTVDESNPFNTPSAAESAPVTIAGTHGEVPVMTNNPAAPNQNAELSPEELLKRAKKKKKIAKSNFRFFK